MHGADAGHEGGEWHFAVHLTAALRNTMTAFESHEKSEQDNFFTFTSIWHAVVILDGRQHKNTPVALDAITWGKDTRHTWHCSCLVSNVCV